MTHTQLMLVLICLAPLCLIGIGGILQVIALLVMAVYLVAILLYLAVSTFIELFLDSLAFVYAIATLSIAKIRAAL